MLCQISDGMDVSYHAVSCRIIQLMNRIGANVQNSEFDDSSILLPPSIDSFQLEIRPILIGRLYEYTIGIRSIGKTFPFIIGFEVQVESGLRMNRAN